MDWTHKKYRVQLNNGERKSVSGIANGLFGLSDAGVLTHLVTGYRVAQFPDQQSGCAAGDYLATVYAAEFEALKRAFKKSMSYDRFRALSETVDLNAKICGDRYFNRLLAAAVERDDP